MPFIIDQNLCVVCGSCFSNCPNRAITKRESAYIVTAMCSDCGSCVRCCAVGAIGAGETKADFDNKKIGKAIKDKLRLRRDIVAMKFVDKAPEGIPIEEGPQFWCSICGDTFEGNGSPLFFTGRASACGGSIMVGVGAPESNKDEFKAAMDAFVVGEGRLFATNDLISKGRELFPLFPKQYGGVIIGSLEHIEMPDLILFPINVHQMTVISTAYAFETGNVITGYSGAPMCIQAIPIPLVENQPVFTTGDWGGRTRSRMKDDEMLVSIPYRLIPGLVKNMDRTIYAQESHNGKE